MPIITLTTDLGIKDFYVAAIKGRIYGQLADVNIVDITHQIDKFNIAQAAFVIKNCFNEFPKGSIHIIGVRPEKNDHVEHLVALYKGHYFIGADNGVFSLIFDTPPEKLMSLNLRESEDGRNFPTKDIFVQAACHLARGGTPEVIGIPKNSINERTSFAAVVSQSNIKGVISYIDSYGNVITNISKELFFEIGKGRNFSITFGNSKYIIEEIKAEYQSSVEGEVLAIFGSTGFLEIAICMGNASELLGLNLQNSVTVFFT